MYLLPSINVICLKGMQKTLSVFLHFLQCFLHWHVEHIATAVNRTEKNPELLRKKSLTAQFMLHYSIKILIMEQKQNKWVYQNNYIIGEGEGLKSDCLDI